MTRYAQNGDHVLVHFVCKLEDGTVVESTDKPKHFILGRKHAIMGLDNGIVGMQVGEKRLIKIKPEHAYGYQQKDLISEIPKQSLPHVENPEIGQRLVLTTKQGKPIHARILKINPESFIVDVNHPLAGQKLIFDVVLMDLKP